MSLEHASQPEKSQNLRSLVIELANELVPDDPTRSADDNLSRNAGAQILLTNLLQVPRINWETPPTRDEDRPITPVSSGVQELYKALGEVVQRGGNG